MASPDLEAWLPAALGLLAPRRLERVLACGVGISGARHLATAVGRDGHLVVVMAPGDAARQLAELDLPHVQVLAHAWTGNERFGTFDALLLVAAAGPVPPLGAFGDLARSNLRPGGRFVMDVPGEDLLPILSLACADLGWSKARTATLHGLDDAALADALRGAGLRNVHPVLGGHLVSVAAGDLVGAFAATLQLDPAEQRELTHALIRRQGSTEPFGVMMHRTRVTALR